MAYDGQLANVRRSLKNQGIHHPQLETGIPIMAKFSASLVVAMVACYWSKVTHTRQQLAKIKKDLTIVSPDICFQC